MRWFEKFWADELEEMNEREILELYAELISRLDELEEKWWDDWTSFAEMEEIEGEIERISQKLKFIKRWISEGLECRNDERND